VRKNTIAKLQFKNEPSNSPELFRKNIFDRIPQGHLVRLVKKVVEGRTDKLPKADEFTFNLFSAENLKDPVATAKSKADGTITFENLQVKGAGTYHYIIKEDTSTAVAGVTFDTEAKEVTVAATFQSGVLTATVTSAEPTFTNTYKATPAKETITAKKVLNGKGKELAAGQFKFELKEGDNVIETVTNAADGTVTFKAIDFAKAGVYTYTITEVKGDDENIKYDENSYKVTVTVTDNGAGQLVTTVEGNNPTITNTYTEPKKEEPKEDPKGEQPKGDLPNTGGADFTAFSTILGLVLAALAGLVYRAKKVD